MTTLSHRMPVALPELRVTAAPSGKRLETLFVWTALLLFSVGMSGAQEGIVSSSEYWRGPSSYVQSGFNASSADSTILIPAQSDWTYRGLVVPTGSPGQWDLRIDGSFTPSTVVRKGSLLYLYYVGADGDRSTDGGPRHRKLGVATSTDGLVWTKHAANPLISHQAGISGSEESGVFSAGARVAGDGTVVVYFGGMEEYVLDAVDSDGVLATSSDGVNFTVQGDVIDHTDPSVYRYGDEIFPIGAYERSDGTWHVYYVGKGSGGVWDLGLASGSSRDILDAHVGVLDLSDEIKSGGDPIELSSSSIAVPINVVGSSSSVLQIRTTTPDDLGNLSTIAAQYDFGDINEFTMYVDKDLGMWMMFYNTDAEDGIHLRTAGPLSVAVTSPSTGSRVTQGDDVTITADAYALYGDLSKVEFYADGSKIGEDTASPYSFTWQTPDAGQYSVKAVAINGAGVTAESQEVVVDVAAPPLLDGRVTDGLRLLYRFQETGGNVVYDVSGVGTDVDLTIGDPGAVTWLNGSGLGVDASTITSSSGSAAKLIDAAMYSNEISLEAWVAPQNVTQNGPARIVTVSDAAVEPLASLGQGQADGEPSDVYDARRRTTSTDLNGLPSLVSPSGSATAELQHVVFTREASGSETLYIDGTAVATETVSGDLSNWSSTMYIFLANSADGNHPWLGTLRLVAAYSRALSPAEVQQNFNSGPPRSFGDTSTDGQVSAYDAGLILRHTLGRITLSGSTALAADVSADGTITVDDALETLMRSVGLTTCFTADPSCP